MQKLFPKCLHNKELSLCHTGHVLPCCWINGSIESQEFRKLFSKEMHIDNFADINDIFKTDNWLNFFDMLKNKPKHAPNKCKSMCSVPLDIDPEGDMIIQNYKSKNHKT